MIEPDTRANNDTAPARPFRCPRRSPTSPSRVVAGPATAQSGSRQDVSWRVRNIGDIAIAGTATWKDRVFLSLDGVLDASDVLLGETPCATARSP